MGAQTPTQTRTRAQTPTTSADAAVPSAGSETGARRLSPRPAVGYMGMSLGVTANAMRLSRISPDGFLDPAGDEESENGNESDAS